MTIQDKDKSKSELISELDQFRHLVKDIRQQDRSVERAVASLSPLGILVYKETGQCIWANERAGELTNIPRDDLLAENFRENEVWRSSGMTDTVLACLQSGEEQHLEVWFQNDLGARTWLDCSFSILIGSDEARVLLTLTDISRLKLREAELARERARYQQIYNVAPTGLFTVDLGRVITTWNEGAARITGYSADEVIGKACDVFANTPCDEKCGLYSADVAKPVTCKRCTVRTRDGEERIIEKNVDLVRDQTGAVVGGVECFVDITARVAAEEQLETFRQFSEAATQGFGMATLDGRIQYMNPALCRMLGADALSDEIGTEFMRFYPEQHQETLHNEMLPAVMAGRTWAGELEHNTEYGRKYPTYETFFLIRDKQGEPCRLAAVISDITRQKRADQELERNRQQLELMVEERTSHLEGVLRELTERERFIDGTLETVPALVYIYDMQKQSNLYCNSGVERILGFTPEQMWEMGDQVFVELMHPDDLPAIVAFQDKILAADDGEILEIPYRIRNAAGDWLHVRSFESPFLRDDSGTVIQKVGALVDETERFRGEQTRSELLASLGAGVVLHAPDTSILVANPTACELLGLTMDQMLGKTAIDPAWRFVREDGSPMLLEEYPVNQVVATGVLLRNYVVGINRTDREETTWALCNANPVSDDDGQLLQVIVTFLDITEHKRAENARKLIEAQLRQQQKLNSIGTLAGGVAHEINNPINGIMNYAQLIKDRSADDERLQTFAGEIIHETERVANIVRNLLTFARGDKIGKRPVQVRDVISDTLSLIKTVIKQDKIILDIEIPLDLPMVICHNQQIQQILMNLITNARDALNERYANSDPDKIIQVKARNLSSDDSDYVRITVEDFGTGIPPEIREQIFEPFFTTKPKDIGTGLGLAISHGIAKDNGGQLTVESEIGQYTRFHLDIPVCTP